LERIYAICNTTRKEAYVGRTSRTIEQRWQQHLADARNPFYEKRLSEALRHDPEAWTIDLCEEGDSFTEASEAEWMQRFVADGWTLLNTAAGAKRAPKRRDTDKPWKGRPIYVPRTPNGVALLAITQEEDDEMRALPTAEARWAWVDAKARSRPANTAAVAP